MGTISIPCLIKGDCGVGRGTWGEMSTKKRQFARRAVLDPGGA